MRKITSMDIEIAVAKHFNMLQNLIVPNVSWMIGHECDVIILSKAGIASEVEIKVSASDLKADALKRHGHRSKLIHKLYFAIPDYMEKDISFIPEHAGILIVSSAPNKWCNKIKCIRDPKRNKLPKWDDKLRYNLLRLSTMRIWTLKEKLNKQLKQREEQSVKLNKKATFTF
jgi:hypothetical protein